MAEDNISFAIVSEPPINMKSSNTLFLSKDRSAALIWKPECSGDWNCRFAIRQTFVVAYIGDIAVISCYVSPNASVNIFLRFLDKLTNAIKSIAVPFLVSSDFNAHSTLSMADRRGELLERWSTSLDCRLLNIGNAYTCVRPQGCSIVDLSWASPTLLD